MLAEKSSWSVSCTVPADSSQPPQQWETEKNQLAKARDEALAQAKVITLPLIFYYNRSPTEYYRLLLSKRRRHWRRLRIFASPTYVWRLLRCEHDAHRPVQEKFQARIQDLSKARVADSERAAAQQKAAVDAAIEKLRGELQAAPSSTALDEMVARHAQELRELESKLTAKFQEEMKAAVEAAASAARAEAAPSIGGDQEAMVQQAIAAHEQKLREQHEVDIAAAVERGRMEASAKGKIKDQQLVRAQHKLKELEAQILTWKQTGVIKETTPTTAAKSTPGSAVTPTLSGASASASTSTAPGSKTLPRKLTLNTTGQPTQAVSAAGAGRGRGVALRGAARGAAHSLAIKGTAAGRGAPVQTSPGTAAESSGVSIMGAATKRAREEGDASSGEDSLAKRLKPADGSSKPVTLRRDRVPPPP